MSLHARSVALGAGATGEQVDRVARELADAGDVRPERALLILERLRSEAHPVHKGAAS
jgi:hydroxymethylglutaryl-CoA reductase